MKRLLVALVLPLVVLVSGCGSDNDPETATPTADLRAACESVLGELHDAAQEVVSRLVSGMTREQFSERAGDVRVAADKVTRADAGAVSPGCLEVYNRLAIVAERTPNIDTLWDACETAAQFIDAASCEDSRDVIADGPEDYAAMEVELGRASTALAGLS